MIRRLAQTARRQAAALLALLVMTTAATGCVGTRNQGREQAQAQTPATPAAVQPKPGDPDAALLAEAVRFIEPFEGRRHRVYADSLGNLTIGVGFNLDRPGAAEDVTKLLPGISYQALRNGTARLSDKQIDTLLRHDATEAIASARRHVQNFDELPRQAQLVLVDMSFNLGSLHAWPDLRAAIAAEDFATAADEMHDSRWRKQTGQRAKHLIALMASLDRHG